MKNNPPRILPDSLSPNPIDGPKTMGTLCQAYKFYASVVDSDPDDTIYWRYFIDYRKDQPGLLDIPPREEPPGAHAGAARAIDFDINPRDERFGLNAERFCAPHTVELFISDRPIDDQRDPRARVAEEDGLTDTLYWAIDLVDGADPLCVN